MKINTWLLLLGLCLLVCRPLISAEEVGQFSPGARKQGPYTALELGGMFMTGFDREYSNGWVVGVKAGHDFFRFFGVEAYFRFSGHNSSNVTVTSGVTPSFFAYQVGGLMKGAYPITRRLFAGLGVGGGLFMTNPNSKPGRTGASHPMFLGEMSLEYFMRTRGISFGINPSIAAVQNHKSTIFQASSYLRYSF